MHLLFAGTNDFGSHFREICTNDSTILSYEADLPCLGQKKGKNAANGACGAKNGTAAASGAQGVAGAT